LNRIEAAFPGVKMTDITHLKLIFLRHHLIIVAKVNNNAKYTFHVSPCSDRFKYACIIEIGYYIEPTQSLNWNDVTDMLRTYKIETENFDADNINKLLCGDDVRDEILKYITPL
jgi:hypothetical protein